MATVQPPLFELRQVSRSWRRDGVTTVGLDAVNLTIASGERVGVVGGSGSGKTTMMRLLTALDRPTAGSVWFDGVDITRARARDLGELRSRVQVVFQDPRSSLDPRMRAGELVTEPLRSRVLRRRNDVPANRAARGAEVLTAVGLDPAMADRFPHEFSGGQRQRLAIARALAPRPEVLIADEPVSALDVSVRAQVLNVLTTLVAREHLTLILVSHDLAVVRHLCTRIIVIDRGHIVEDGAAEQVWNDPQAPETRALMAARLRLPDLNDRADQAAADPHPQGG